MIWIESRRLLFVHNPKCAGTSVHKALMTQFPDAKALWGRRYESGRDAIRDLAHMTVAEARAELGLTEAFRSFGFVRDPYARFVSSYRHLKHWNRDLERLTPEELAFDLLDEERIRFDWKFIHFAPQYRFFYEGPVRTAEIYKVEDMSAAWAAASKAFGLSAGLPRENRLDGEGGTGLSHGVIARLNLLYARDFKLFDYPMVPAPDKARDTRDLYAKFVRLWPERRNMDISDKTEI
ncbi:MAG: sulfotransferase family 2 domain-containing protein [Alphaproteobacteria bacterium]|nr:sulfotransferase family 2 domain-containing protein [Alphaproteobacteria bacterium]MBV9694720.1 sulfotransferase family 2 domain-containing protein [Alphaproteobacteria bacterium]